MDALLLKADLIAAGVTVTKELGDRLGVRDLPNPAVDLTLPTGVLASVPLVPPGDSYHLLEHSGRMVVEPPGGVGDATRRIPVDAAQTPRFSTATASSGTPMHRIAERRGRLLIVTPLGRCGYGFGGQPCTFCIEGGRPAAALVSGATVADVVETVTAARRETAIDVVLFNTDSVEAEDGGVAFLAPYVRAVRRHAAVLVAAHLHPPRTVAWVDRAYALGLDAVSYGLEVFDADTLGRLCVGRARYLGRPRYLEMLARAAAVFPRGAVWADLVVGVEPAESTLAGIDALARMGVVPVLTIPRAPEGSRHWPAPAQLPQMVARLAEAPTIHGVPSMWLREVASSITPAEARGAIHRAPAVRGRLGAQLAVRGARTLSSVRRRLRVRYDTGSGHSP